MSTDLEQLLFDPYPWLTKEWKTQQVNTILQRIAPKNDRRCTRRIRGWFNPIKEKKEEEEEVEHVDEKAERKRAEREQKRKEKQEIQKERKRKQKEDELEQMKKQKEEEEKIRQVMEELAKQEEAKSKKEEEERSKQDRLLRHRQRVYSISPQSSAKDDQRKPCSRAWTDFLIHNLC